MNYSDLLPHFKQQAQIILEKAKEELSGIRTGRATPALIEGVMVDAYGVKMRLMDTASITTDGAQTLIVQPFDSGITQSIEKAILESPLGISPSNQSGRLFIKIPPLSEEQRGKLIKVVGTIIEDKRNALRLSREDIRRHIKVSFEKKEITEDDKFKAEKDLDASIKDFDAQLINMKDKKEAELKTV